jgi:hypothetical protein
MKFRMIIRMQMTLMMLGAALMLASSVYAQQDMDPASFPDGPNVMPFDQPVNVNANSTFTMSATNTATLAPSVQVSEDSAVQAASVAQWTPSDAWSMTTLIISMGLLVLYGALEGWRERNKMNSRPRVLNPSNATAR